MQRAIALEESEEKHLRIQALTSIISRVIEECPSTPPDTPQNQSNLFMLILKIGLAKDLAQILFSLDLSSGNMATTVNSALEPLKKLSRIANQDQSQSLVLEATEQQNIENPQSE